MGNTIITINREAGSGGGEIARLLGEKLGYKVYGRSLLESVAKEFDLTMENMDRIKAQKTNWWSDFCRLYQQFGAVSYNLEPFPAATPMGLYYAEERLLRDLAEKESCVIIGRAGFHIFRDNPDAIKLLIIADRDARIARISRKQNVTAEEAARILDKIDQDRDTFVKTVADTSRYDARNYDFVLNVTGMKPETAVDFLAENIRLKLAMHRD